MILLLCCAIIAGACAVEPDDFEDPVALTATYPLKNVSVNNVHLFVGSKEFTRGYCLAPDSTVTVVPIPGFDTLHTFTGSVIHVNDKWFLNFELQVEFPNDGINMILFFNNPQPRGFVLRMDSLEIPEEMATNHVSGTCPDGSAQMKVAVLKSRWDPPYYDGWKDFQDIQSTLQLDLKLEEISDDRIRISGKFQMYSNLKIQDDRGGSNEEEEIVYSTTANLVME